jgi:hypothetical protein
MTADELFERFGAIFAGCVIVCAIFLLVFT